jgi:hypothetical protein
MKTSLHDASARQHSGEPLGANDGRKDRLRSLALAEVDGEIAELVGQSTQGCGVRGGDCITSARLWASVAI